MNIRQLLLETLNRLGDDDFDTFKWHCINEKWGGRERIPESYLDKKPRTITVSKLAEYYHEEKAVSVTIEILETMDKKPLADELKKKYADGTSTSSSAQSSQDATAPVASMSAQQGSVIIAPRITGSTTGTLNINISKQ